MTIGNSRAKYIPISILRGRFKVIVMGNILESVTHSKTISSCCYSKNFFKVRISIVNTL